MYSRESSLREERVFQRRKTPSFSSSLLDAIYRSIDDETNGEDEFSLYRETTTTTVKKKQSTTFEGGDDEHERVNLRRAIMIEKWTEKQRIRTSRILNSTSSSSDSSSGGTFSSSETEARSTPSCFTPIRSKQFRTRRDATQSDPSDYKPKVHDEEGSGSFAKTKLRALKIYGDLKKSKHSPISPGRRIASFLNSLFNAKKDKACSVEAMEDLRSLRKSNPATTPVETCSSASSFSRSCLSKTPSSRGKLSNGTKRSVRFYPVSVIVDEDCRPCGVKKVFSATPFQNNVDQARDILRGYNQKKKKKKSNYGFELRDLVVNGGGEDEEDEDEDEDEEDDGAESYASSDLFELENVIGIGRYREELPVYETTNLKTNQAIAHGLIL